MFSRTEFMILFLVVVALESIIYFFTLNQGCHLGCIDFARSFTVSALTKEGNGAHLYDFAFFQHALSHSIEIPSALMTAWLYPPVYTLLLEPLAYFSYAQAFVLFMLVQAVLFFIAGYKFLWQRPYEIVFALTPVVWIALLWGKNAVFIAALYIAAFRWLDKKPVLAGIVMGLTIIKPQMGLLLPVLLLSGRYYTAAIAATLSALCFIGLSIIVYGTSPWLDYITIVFGAASHSQEISGLKGALYFGMPSIYTLLYYAGLPDTICKIAQALSAITCVILLIRLRSEWIHEPKTALLYVSVLTLFVSPYLGEYDYVLAVTMIIFTYLNSLKPTQCNITALLFLCVVSYLVFIHVMVWKHFTIVICPALMIGIYGYIRLHKAWFRQQPTV